MGAQANGQQGGQVYWDAQTGQPYTMQQQPKNGMGKLLGRMLGIAPNQKNYLSGFGLNNNEVSAMDEMLARARQQSTQTNAPSITDLFPQLASSQYLQGQDLQPTQQNINPYAQYNMLQGEQTAPAPVSSGAGRFMGTTK